MLIFDLDGTLLHDDKTISEYTRSVLEQCRTQGLRMVIATARSACNAEMFVSEIEPEIVISCDGALIVDRSAGNRVVWKDEFSETEVRLILEAAWLCAGRQVEITIDTTEKHYWNHKDNYLALGSAWGKPVYTDYEKFREPALKICVELTEPEQARMIADSVCGCSAVKFSGSNWYKFTKASSTKGSAVKRISSYTGIDMQEMIAFGDDRVDVEMLELCGRGIAPANAVPEAKDAADLVVESNEQDGIARYLEEEILRKKANE